MTTYRTEEELKAAVVAARKALAEAEEAAQSNRIDTLKSIRDKHPNPKVKALITKAIEKAEPEAANWPYELSASE